MPNDLVISEETAKLREDLAAERAGRVAAERFGAAALARADTAPPLGPPEEDGYERFSADSMKLSPEEQRALLDRGTRTRIHEEVAPELAGVERRTDQKLRRLAYDQAFDAALAQNPDMAESPEHVAAAAAAVQYDLGRQKRGAAPGEFARMVVGKYREMFKKPDSAAPAPPYVEGSSAPSVAAPLHPQAPPPPDEPNPFVEWYGEEAADTKRFGPGAQEDFRKMTEGYALDKNEYLDGKGSRSLIPRVVKPLMKRKKERREQAAAAK